MASMSRKDGNRVLEGGEGDFLCDDKISIRRAVAVSTSNEMDSSFLEKCA